MCLAWSCGRSCKGEIGYAWYYLTFDASEFVIETRLCSTAFGGRAIGILPFALDGLHQHIKLLIEGQRASHFRIAAVHDVAVFHRKAEPMPFGDNGLREPL